MLFCDLRGFTAFPQTADGGGDRGSARVPRGPRRAHPQVRSARCAALPGMASSSCSTIRCHVDPALAPFGSPSRCATTLPRLRPTGASWISARVRVGIAHGYAALGRIGCEGRFDSRPTARSSISPRDCARGKKRTDPDRQQGVGQDRGVAETEPVGGLVLKGFHVRSKPSM